MLTELSTPTLALMPVLNLLIQPGRTQAWLRTLLVSALARLPLRPRGVQHTIEFVLSVHPSTSGSNAPASTGRGASISHDALNAASKLLSSPPAETTAEDWFNGLAPQLLSLLDGEGELELDKAAAFVIGFGILGKRQYGAPGKSVTLFRWPRSNATGTPGWNAFVRPILGALDPAMASARKNHIEAPHDSIKSLEIQEVLVTSTDIAKSLHRLSTLITSHPHPTLSKRLLRPILLPLWSLSAWPQHGEGVEEKYRAPARSLLKILLQLSPASTQAVDTPGPPSSSDLLTTILQNLTFKGRSTSFKLPWQYSASQDGGIQVERVIASEANSQLDLQEIDAAIESFIALLANTADLEPEISILFMGLCKKWLASSANIHKPSIITRLEQKDDREDIESRLIEAKVMQKMMTSLPESLIGDSKQVLDLVNEVLLNFLATAESGGSEDTVAVALSLLSIVLTSPNFRVSPDTEPCLASIEDSVRQIGRKQLEVSSTAQNLALLLSFRNAISEQESASMSTPTDRQVEDRKSYNLAMSYLTATDSPPPVRAQGLELLSSLIRTNSAILNIPALLVLFSSLLQDEEEYIYLRAIKSFILLSQNHPKSVMKDLIERYVDPEEESELDQRLRLGEALLQVIQDNPRAFTGEAAQTVCEGLLFLAGRRGFRPKTQTQQEKQSKLKQKQNSEASDAWGGDVPQLDDMLGTEAEFQESQILAHIVSGWESKRGSEDVRIRASALAILGSGIEANISGVLSTLISAAVDTSIHTLNLEPELEKAILRRAAILLIMSFVRALDTAREQGKRLGFGIAGQSLDDIRAVVGYVASSDNDGLVRQHARDVVEGLQAWQLNALLPSHTEQNEIQQLAGLNITPMGVEDSSGRVRPRIEEIE